MKYIKRFESIDWNFIDEEKPDIMPEFEGNEDFYNFLVNNDALDKFIYNYNKYKFRRYETINLKEFLKINKIKFIEESFKWSKTPEGWEFWNILNEKWRNKLKI